MAFCLQIVKCTVINAMDVDCRLSLPLGDYCSLHFLLFFLLFASYNFECPCRCSLGLMPCKNIVIGLKKNKKARVFYKINLIFW